MRARHMRVRSLAVAQCGLGLVEVVVAMALFGAVVAIMGPLLTSAMGSGQTLENQSRASDGLRLAVARIDRELRSAECISAPARGVSGSTLTFTTHAGTAGPYEVSYAVNGETFERTVGTTSTVIAEAVVASGHEFTHAGETGQHPTVDVAIAIGVDESPRSIETTVTGRNAWSAC